MKSSYFFLIFNENFMIFLDFLTCFKTTGKHTLSAVDFLNDEIARNRDNSKLLGNLKTLTAHDFIAIF